MIGLLKIEIALPQKALYLHNWLYIGYVSTSHQNVIKYIFRLVPKINPKNLSDIHKLNNYVRLKILKKVYNEKMFFRFQKLFLKGYQNFESYTII